MSQVIFIGRGSVLILLGICTRSQLIYHSTAHPWATGNDCEQVKDHEDCSFNFCYFVHPLVLVSV